MGLKAGGRIGIIYGSSNTLLKEETEMGIKRKAAGVITAAMVTLGLAGVAYAEKVTIAGDPCSIPLIARLAEAYSKTHKDFKVEITNFGCTLGVYNAANGEFDLGVSTQNGLSSNLPKGAVNNVIAKSPIVLVVNKSNPVNNLTYKDLQGIFSGKIKNWKEVGGKDLELKNVMLEPCVRHTMSKQVVLYSDTITLLTPGKKANPVDQTNKLVAENEGAIGQQIYGYESNEVKVITVDGALPDERSLHKTYTFYQDFNVVTKGEPRGAIKDFIEFANSPQGKEAIKSVRHIPSKD